MVKNCLNIDNIKICIYIFKFMIQLNGHHSKKKWLLKSTNNIWCVKKPSSFIYSFNHFKIMKF